MFSNTFWALVPSITAIILALIIREPHISLFIGSFLAAMLIAGLNPVKAVDLYITDGILRSISDNAGIIAFVVILGIIIQMINKSNGSAAFGKWAAKHIKTQQGAMFATFILGILIFIDDMFNCFTVGAVMMPVTDRCRMSRQKLAYLLDATAAPVCMIAPISSWGAAVSSTAAGLGTGISGIGLFIKAIPYNFYSILTLAFIVIIGILNFDYGEMKKYQLSAKQSRDNSGKNDDNDTEGVSSGKPDASIADLAIPVVFMIVVCTVCMLYVGGFFDTASDYYGSIALALGNTDGAVALSMGGIITLVFVMIYYFFRRSIDLKGITECVGNSFKIMGSPLIILILAVSLKNMTATLGVSCYIATLMKGAASELYHMLPAVIFLAACLFSFASGTSWGTFGILIPIVTAIFASDSGLMIIAISACLAGAVCGDHCSPISDTTIMSSAAAQCDHITHVTTQLPYAVTVAVISFITYCLAGFIQNAAICLIAGISLTVAALLIIRTVSSHSAKGDLNET